MTMSRNCPRCGTPLESDATLCTACGLDLRVGPPPSPPEPPTTPATGAEAAPPAASEPAERRGTSAGAAASAVQANLAAYVGETLERWNVERSPYLIAMAVLAAIAVLMSSFAAVSYLVAGEDEALQKLDAQVTFRLALGAAIGAAALALLVRLNSGRLRETERNPDLTVGLVIFGFAAAFALAGLFKGFDESLDAVDAWFSYALVFAFLAIAWFAVSRPTPPAVGGLNAASIGLAVIAVACAALAIGWIQGRSEDFSTYAGGVSLLRAGVVLMHLSFAWFLGLKVAPG